MEEDDSSTWNYKNKACLSLFIYLTYKLTEWRKVLELSCWAQEIVTFYEIQRFNIVFIRVSATGPYSEPDDSSPNIHIIFFLRCSLISSL